MDKQNRHNRKEHMLHVFRLYRSPRYLLQAQNSPTAFLACICLHLG